MGRSVVTADLGMVVVASGVMEVALELGLSALGRIEREGVLVIEGVARVLVHLHRIEQAETHPECTAIPTIALRWYTTAQLLVAAVCNARCQAIPTEVSTARTLFEGNKKGLVSGGP